MNRTTIIKTGICSFGMSGKLFHAPFINAHPGFELTAIVERSKNESRERYPASKLVRSVDELFEDDSLQLIIINTPVQTHFEYAKKAMLKGKHVIVEKPFSVTSAQSQELVDVAQSQHVHLFVYQNRRYDGDFNAVKEVITSKLIGNVKEAEIRYDRYRPEISPKAHKESDLPGAGITYDLGAHLADQAIQLFGWPTAVFADMMAMRDHSPVDDYVEIILYYTSLRVRLKASCFVKEPVQEYIINGSLGSFLQKRSDLQETMLLKGVAPSQESWCPAPDKPDGFLHTTIDGKEIREERTSVPGNYMNYFEDVYQTLVNGAPNPVPGEDGVRSITLIEAAKRSAKEGKVINV
jgi:scyllo-inositol 2-dehydrogenase (NADP+)